VQGHKKTETHVKAQAKNQGIVCWGKFCLESGGKLLGFKISTVSQFILKTHDAACDSCLENRGKVRNTYPGAVVKRLKTFSRACCQRLRVIPGTSGVLKTPPLRSQKPSEPSPCAAAGKKGAKQAMTDHPKGTGAAHRNRLSRGGQIGKVSSPPGSPRKNYGEFCASMQGEENLSVQ